MIFQDPFASLNPIHRSRYHLRRPLRIHGHARLGRARHELVAELLERVT